MTPAPESFRKHPLHDADRHWPETNCYTDLWIEILASRGHVPEAMLAFTVRQDFEGDQFTFFKPPLEDLETLYGIGVQELAVFDTLERHAQAQIARGRMPLVEVDGFFLPDTDGVSYRLQHTKTTIGIARMDAGARRIDYFHNSGLYRLEGDDYAGIFGPPAHPAVLFPYTEFVKFNAGPPAADLAAASAALLQKHLRFRPDGNPIADYARAFPTHAADLAARPAEYFHAYAFNTLRQLGANFELLGSYLAWLGSARLVDLTEESTAAMTIAGGAKSAQFMLARAMARGRLAAYAPDLDPMIEAYETVFATLSDKIG